MSNAWETFKATPGACPTCWGSGKIANDDDKSPWPTWEELKPPANMAVVMGLVRPIECPSCGGSGKAVQDRDQVQVSEQMAFVLGSIVAERHRQDEKWGLQRHSWVEWIAILGEEFGEASKEAVECNWHDDHRLIELRTELVQTAAVAVQAIEHIDEVLGNDPGEGGNT